MSIDWSTFYDKAGLDPSIERRLYLFVANRRAGLTMKTSRRAVADQHDRLRKRTEQLRASTAALSITAKPFDKAEHAAHKVRLRKHRFDLAAHAERQIRQFHDEMRAHRRTPIPPMPLSELPAMKALLEAADAPAAAKGKKERTEISAENKKGT
jgi:hypothetical protein